MTSPFRRDVVLTAFVLAVPLFLLALRGDLTVDEVITRLPWCLAAGWAAVALIRWASTPPKPQEAAATGPVESAETESQPSSS
ncbi:hypothetical protein [Modestobacter italicus]|uniref:hypothetical protein n=1 Tax=Modestobacter italicus (strain DSM 44449 / CECT 9708 / BC 501) TaxID=2732864 RepID=UPI001C988932|nr:hypothetical protein [Modestobacter italicus]